MAFPGGYQMQAQQLVSRQTQSEEIIYAQTVLDITQSCIENIKKLGNLLIEESSSKGNISNNSNNNSDDDDNDDDSKTNDCDSDDDGDDSTDPDVDMDKKKPKRVSKGNVKGTSKGNLKSKSKHKSKVKSKKDLKTNSKDKNNDNNDIGITPDTITPVVFQQMLTGQLLNALRLALSSPKSSKYPSASDLSMIELGKFKQELLKGNIPDDLVKKLLPFVETMQVTLQDYKKSFHIPAPKLNATTFNQEEVSAGMGKFLGAQHKADNRQNEIKNNAKKIGQKQNEALNGTDNKKLIKEMKNEKIDKSKMNVDSLLFDIDKKHLDFDDKNDENDANDDEEVALTVMYGRDGMKEESRRQVELNAQKAREQSKLRSKGKGKANSNAKSSNCSHSHSTNGSHSHNHNKHSTGYGGRNNNHN